MTRSGRVLQFNTATEMSQAYLFLLDGKSKAQIYGSKGTSIFFYDNLSAEVAESLLKTRKETDGTQRI